MTTHYGSVPAIAELKLEVKIRRLDDLLPHPRNPRVHSPRQIKKLADNIIAWGFVVPVLTDAAGQILAGHARVLAARRAGMTEVPTIRIDHLNDKQARALMLADNRLGELSTWDDEKLGELLLDLSLNVDLSLELTGFDLGEIDIRIEGIGAADKKAKADLADTVPVRQPGPPVSQVGDLWALGRHRLLCGNALAPDSFVRLMDGLKANACITDPPYNVPIRGHVSGLGRIEHREFPMACGEMIAAAFTDFLGDALSLCAKHSIDGSLH